MSKQLIDSNFFSLQNMYELIVWLLGKSSKKHYTFEIQPFLEQNISIVNMCFRERFWRIITLTPRPNLHHIIVNNRLFITIHHLVQKRIIFLSFDELSQMSMRAPNSIFFKFMSNPNIEPLYEP